MRVHSCDYVRVQESKGYDKTRKKKRRVGRIDREDSYNRVRVQKSKSWDKKKRRKENGRSNR